MKVSVKTSSSARDAPKEKRFNSYLCTPAAYDTLCVSGYTRLSNCPEVQMGINLIADLVSSMTIYLMQNTDRGDVRVKNELSRMLDITPAKGMTRKTWIYNNVKTMLLEGNSVCIPQTSRGLLQSMPPVPPSRVSFRAVPGGTYEIMIGGVNYDPDDLLHFVSNPDPEFPYWGAGYRVELKEVVHNLRQAAATKKGFLESKWQPSVIVRVDALADEFSGPKGRSKFIDEYLTAEKAGQPWVIPSELLDVTQVKPLSLTDLAINEGVSLDKRTVAGILDVPAFVLGVGEFKKEEWNAWINSRIRTIADSITQEITRKILYSPSLYVKMSPKNLYAYDIQQLTNVAIQMRKAAMMTGNEGRDLLDLEPREGLDELVMLENYIPADRLGDQKKLISKGGEADED